MTRSTAALHYNSCTLPLSGVGACKNRDTNQSAATVAAVSRS